MEYEYFNKDKAIFHIDTHGDKFYILLQGTVGVYIRIDKNLEATQKKEEEKKKGRDNKNEKNAVIELTCVKELSDG